MISCFNITDELDNKISDSVKVIYSLLIEIDEICKRNNIDYFLANRLALIAYRGNEGDDYNTGRIFMTAENLKKFIKACEVEITESRVIEWMGNNERFPGVFLRYINTDSTYYTTKRLCTENNLGMFITIDVLRPARKNEKYYHTIENAWKNFSFDMPAGGKKWENKVLKILKTGSAIFGREKISKFLIKFFLNRYQSKYAVERFYLHEDVKKTRRYYSTNFFKEAVNVKLYDKYFKVPQNLDKYIKKQYAFPRQESKSVIPNNTIDYFCDPNISYKELDLLKYRNEIKNIRTKLQLEIRKALKVIKERDRCFDLMLRSYYRYYYGLVVFKDMDYLESLYLEKNFDELDRALFPYYRLALKYSQKNLSLFIGERINRLLEKRYNANLEKLFPQTPQIFKEGIKLYNYKSEFLKSIWR